MHSLMHGESARGGGRREAPGGRGAKSRAGWTREARYYVRCCLQRAACPVYFPLQTMLSVCAPNSRQSARGESTKRWREPSQLPCDAGGPRVGAARGAGADNAHARRAARRAGRCAARAAARSPVPTLLERAWRLREGGESAGVDAALHRDPTRGPNPDPDPDPDPDPNRWRRCGSR